MSEADVQAGEQNGQGSQPGVDRNDPGVNPGDPRVEWYLRVSREMHAEVTGNDPAFAFNGVVAKRKRGIPHTE